MGWDNDPDLPPYGESAEFGGSASSYQVQEVQRSSEVSPTDLVEEESHESEERLEDAEEEPISACCCSQCSAARPLLCACTGSFLLLLIVIIGLATLPFRIETNFETFLISDVQSSLHRAAFHSATASRSSGSVRRLQASSAKAYTTKDLYLGYSVAGQSGSNGILSTKFLSQIARLEQSLRESAEFIALCNETDEMYRGLCNPGLSFSSYALPSLEISTGSIVPDSMTLDGLGFDPVPIRTAFLVAKEHNLQELFLPTGYDPDLEIGAPSIRSLFRFRFVVGSVSDKVEDRVAAARIVDSKWETFFEDVLMPLLTTSELVQSFKDSMHVWFDGSGFRDFEVRLAVVNDIPLAIGSAIFILCYMLAHTRSLLLALVGPLLAMGSVPIAFIICAAFLGNTTVNFANFLAVFLAVGFGADVMFVYYDSWTQSEERAHSIPNRLAWTYKRAVKASLATTSTTALSFLCNMASVIRALRQFGFFMGVCVLVTWLSLTFIYVPTIVIDHIWCRKIRLSHRSYAGARKSACFQSWGALLFRLRYCVLILTLAAMVVFVATALPALQVGTGMPDIFPPDHNQNAGVQVMQHFESISQAFGNGRQEPPRDVKVCRETDFETTDECLMQWCEARFGVYRPTWEGNGTCTCQRRLNNACGAAASASVRVRFVGPSTLSELQVTQHVADHLLAWPNAGAVQWGTNALAEMLESEKKLPQLLQQVWETGDTSLNDVLEVTAELERQNSLATCGWDEICFCSGELQCKLDTWDGTTTLEMPAVRRLQDVTPARLLQTVTSSVPASQRIKVRAVFGIIPNLNVKLLGERTPEEMWDFNPAFDLSDPWAQRAMYSFCKDIPESLQVTRLWCWFEDFRLFARQFQGRFPVKQVDWGVVSWLFVDTSVSATRGTRYIWLEEEMIKGMYYSFELGESRHAPREEVLALKDSWDSYAQQWNSGSSSSTGLCFHVSDQWVAVESASRLIGSTAMSLAVLCVLALACMLIFTHSIMLSIVVVVSTVLVIIVLSFFITVVMGWEVGLIEVIAFIYFIGYAVDYSLHMVYKYGSSDALTDDELWVRLGPNRERSSLRFQRMSFALKTMGGATVGSAITTAGSSLFLVFCTLTIFAKLGAMCFTVTVASILFALCPLGAYLMTFGPVRPGLCQRCSGGRADRSQLEERQE